MGALRVLAISIAEHIIRYIVITTILWQSALLIFLHNTYWLVPRRFAAIFHPDQILLLCLVLQDKTIVGQQLGRGVGGQASQNIPRGWSQLHIGFFLAKHYYSAWVEWVCLSLTKPFSQVHVFRESLAPPK